MSPTKLLNSNYVLLFQGQLVSQIGSALYFVTLIFWVKHATNSATLMGLLAMSALLPSVVLGPFGGTFADRFSRKKVIVIGDLINGSFMLSIAAVMYFSPTSTNIIVTLLFAAAIVGGAIVAVFRPAISASIPDLVPVSSIDTANGMMQSSSQIALLIGQSVGGVLFRLLGAPFVMVINGASFILSAVSESFITIPQHHPDKSTGQVHAFKAFRTDTVAGFRYVIRKGGLLKVFVTFAILNFFTAPFGVLLPFFVEDTLQSTPDWFGYIIAGMAFGTIVGSVAAGGAKIPAPHKGKFVAGSIAMIGLGFIAFSYARSPMVALLILLLVGVCVGLVNVMITSILQMTTPSEIRGRVFGLLGTLVTGLAPLSMGASGFVADLVGRDIPLIYAVSGGCLIIMVPNLVFDRSFNDLLALKETQGDEPTTIN